MSKLPTSVIDLHARLAGERMMVALLKWEVGLLRRDLREIRANPYWHLQPRAPEGQEDGGRWVPLGPVVQAGLPALVGAAVLVQRLYTLGKRVSPFLRRMPKSWSGDWPSQSEFDEESRGRIGPPTARRPEHPLIRFNSERELRQILGRAGDGREWHHIVEKRLAGERFPAERIHSTDNIVSLPIELHREISRRMSQKQKTHRRKNASRLDQGLVIRAAAPSWNSVDRKDQEGVSK